MGQDEVIKVLERNDKWMTANEINEKLDLGSSSIRASLRILFKHEEIERMKNKNRQKNKVKYKWKIKK